MTATRLSDSLSIHSVLALVGVVLAAIAQYQHTYLANDGIARVLFSVSLALWIIALVSSQTSIGTRIDESAPPSTSIAPRFLRVFALLAVLLALVTFLTSNENTFDLDNVGTWILSIVLFLYAAWEPEKSADGWHKWLRDRWHALQARWSSGLRIPTGAVLLAAILLVGWFFYFHDLDGVPGEMDSDHAEKILDVNDVVNNGLRPIFFERNTGREPLEFYLIAALVEFGNHPIDHMALKLVTATVGFLVIPATFLLAHELFDRDVAFLAAALVAISKWPITIARMGLRFPFTPIFIAPMVYFLIRACKYQRRNDFLMAGLFLGAGLFGYNAFRIAPVLAVALLGLWLVIGKVNRRELPRFFVNGLLVVLLAFIVFVPLFRYSVDHPGDFWYRVLTRLAGAEQPVSENVVTVLGGNLVNAALMFNWTGDQAWPNSIPGDPALDYVTGGLFLFGVVYALYRLVRFREHAYALLLVGLVVMLLPTALAIAFPIENPSNARAGGAIPFVFIVAALPMAWILRSVKANWSPLAAAALAVLLVAVMARVNYVRYFRDFNNSYLDHSWNSDDVARVIRGFANTVGDFDHAYILLYPHWIDTRNVAINMGRIGWDQTLANADAAVSLKSDGMNKLFVLNSQDQNNLARLQDIFPNGQLRTFHSETPGHDFVVWYVPGTMAPSDSFDENRLGKR